MILLIEAQWAKEANMKADSQVVVNQIIENDILQSEKLNKCLPHVYAWHDRFIYFHIDQNS